MNDREWTIMIYMAGDNNLAVDMAYALEQIKSVAKEDAGNVNLFVYYDGSSPAIPTLYCDFSDAGRSKYVRSFAFKDKLYPVSAKFNENAADKRSVLNFVDWCLNKVEVETEGEISYGRRAKRYALIFSGHSLGFQDIGLFKDESTGKTMKMRDLYFVLQRMVSTRKDLAKEVKQYDLEGEEKDRELAVLIGQKLDILGFDSCVMGMLEVGYQFGYVAETMIASEGSVPSAGWTYAKILGNLASRKHGMGDARAVAEHFVRKFIESQDSFTVGGVSVDMAAWDLSHFTGLAAAFDQLAGVLVDCFSDPSSRIYRQMERALLLVHWKCQSYMFDQNVDLGDFCELLDREAGFLIEELDGEDTVILEDLQDCCRNVLEKLNDAVILSGFSGGEYQYSNGVSVFFPWSREGFEASRKNYGDLWFVKDVGRSKKFTWAGFLDLYLNSISRRRVEPPSDAPNGSGKYRYYSGLSFSDIDSVGHWQQAATKIAGHEGTKIAGHEGTKIAGHEGTKIAGHEGTKIAGHEGTKIAGHEGTKIAGHEGTKI
ncbi:MAG TPA: clostripain-related cysteine peptidase, partial [Pyrinomonadaceae bacterium]|nr:clostripain-related cysteine peptidase [Pyrinomonadaceae bacterium]